MLAKVCIFAVLFKSSTERWVSGLNQQFAKLSYGITVPGVRIPLSPQRTNETRRCREFDTFCFCSLWCKFICRHKAMKTKRVDLSTFCGVQFFAWAPAASSGAITEQSDVIPILLGHKKKPPSIGVAF